MPIVFETPRTQSKQCLGAVISSADVERLDAACALAREAPGLSVEKLEQARSKAAELRRATAAAAAGPERAAATAPLRSAIEAFEAFVAAHGAGRPACGRDLASARVALASLAGVAGSAGASEGEQQQ